MFIRVTCVIIIISPPLLNHVLPVSKRISYVEDLFDFRTTVSHEHLFAFKFSETCVSGSHGNQNEMCSNLKNYSVLQLCILEELTLCIGLIVMTTSIVHTFIRLRFDDHCQIVISGFSECIRIT